MGAPSAPHSEAVRAMTMGSKDLAMSVARPAVIRAFALVAFAVHEVCCMNLLVMDEWAMHPRWAKGGRPGWVERCERAVGERSEMWDGCWYFQVAGFSGLEIGIGLEIQGRRFERARMSLVVMEAAVVSVGWE